MWSDDNIVEQKRLIAKLPHRVQGLLVIEWAQSIQSKWVEQYPNDHRPQKAIDSVNDFIITNKKSAQLKLPALESQIPACYGVAEDNNAFDAYHAACAVRCAIYANYEPAPYDCIDVADHAVSTGILWSWLESTYNWTAGPSYPFDPEWRTDTAIQLAKQILANKELEYMPILADALQDAGFSDVDWLTYLQSGRDEWVRSNWLIWNLLELNTDKPVK